MTTKFPNNVIVVIGGFRIYIRIESKSQLSIRVQVWLAKDEYENNNSETKGEKNKNVWSNILL